MLWKLLWLIPLSILGIFAITAFLTVVRLNNELAKAKENEIMSRDFIKRQQEELEKEKERLEKLEIGSAVDKEIELLIEKKRWEDALSFIDERHRLAFEQGNGQREDMYRRYREHIEFETRDRSQDGF